MFAFCLDRTLAAVSELGHHLQMARTLDLVTDKTVRQLEAFVGAQYSTRPSSDGRPRDGAPPAQPERVVVGAQHAAPRLARGTRVPAL